MTEQCPCCSELTYDACCEPFHKAEQSAPTAEALMRSRYAAYAKGKIDYIHRTMHPSTRDQFDEESASAWSRQSEWLGLEIVSTVGGTETDAEGTVEFVAKYKKQDEDEEEHHEIAQFKKDKGK